MVFRIFLLSIAITLFVSCSKSIQPAGSSHALVIYPSPPDTTRIQFLTRISSSSDVEGKRGGFKKFILGKGETKTVGKPYGVCVANGKIYMCDALQRGLEVIDLKTSKFSYFVPTGLGELKNPLNCVVDQQGYLYVTDSDRKQIVVFDEKGSFRDAFGGKEKFKPTDLCISDGKLWVTNLPGHQVNVYSLDSTHTLLKTFPGDSPDSIGYLFSPTNIVVAGDRVYVTDFGDFKVKIFTTDGKFIESIGSYGERLGQFVRPKGLAVDRESNLYVVDAGFENTQIFDKNGKLLMFFGGNYKGPGDMWLPAKVTIDYDNLQYFEKYVDPRFSLKYLILVTNQFGPDKLNIYGHVELATAALKEQNQKKK